MKKLLVLLTLAAFMFSVPLAMAAGETPGAAKAAGDKAPAKINCCIKGKCSQVGSEADCAKEMGKVVKDCKDCK
ncbi:MAG: hypothetical protein ACLP5H_21075 [Desulfomonilaceae bacterium]